MDVSDGWQKKDEFVMVKRKREIFQVRLSVAYSVSRRMPSRLDQSMAVDGHFGPVQGPGPVLESGRLGALSL